MVLDEGIRPPSAAGLQREDDPTRAEARATPAWRPTTATESSHSTPRPREPQPWNGWLGVIFACGCTPGTGTG